MREVFLLFCSAYFQSVVLHSEEVGFMEAASMEDEGAATEEGYVSATTGEL